MKEHHARSGSSRFLGKGVALVLVSAILMFPFQRDAHANPGQAQESGCKAEFDAAKIAVSSEIKGHGAQQGLTAHLKLDLVIGAMG